MKRLFTTIVVLMLLVNMLSSITVASDIFPDLKVQQYDKNGRPLVDSKTNEYIYSEHWAAKSIMKSSRIGFIDGYRQEDGTYVFKPNQAITRAEFIKMAIALAANRTFDFNTIPSDMKHWAGKYVKVAEMQNVLDKGEYTDDNIDEAITRIEMICILSKIQINMKGVAQNRVGKLHYTDIDDLTEDEKGLLLHTAKYTLIKDMLQSTSFEPHKNLTRAEAAVAIMQIY